MTPDNREEQAREALGRVTQMVAPGAEWVEIEAADWATIRAHIEGLEAYKADRESEIEALKFERDRAEARVRELEGLLRDAPVVPVSKQVGPFNKPLREVDWPDFETTYCRMIPCDEEGVVIPDNAIDSAMQGEEVRGG